MRIRNTHDIPPSSSSLSPTGRHFNDHTFARTSSASSESPHVMISRINGRINNIDSTSRSTFNQEQGKEIRHEEEEMYVTPADQSLIGGWREEEKAMPLKKRRFISFEVDQEGSDDIDAGDKMVKVEGKEEDTSTRCGRTDGKRWRCRGRRVEGHSMCEHHLLIRRVRYPGDNLMKREIGEDNGEGDGDDLDNEKKKKKKKKKKKRKRTKAEEGCFGNNDDDNNSNNNNNNNSKKKVKKARSITSLLRDTVPLCI